MHWECFTFFENCRLLTLTSNDVPSVLDVGSYDINGSLKYLFPNSEYTGLDLAEGPNVDVVVSGSEYDTEKRYDITLSCECFEHNPQYLLTFQNMIRLTKDNGLVVFTCATTGRPEHGTKDTSPHSSLASQQVSSNYYKNLVEKDFSILDLDGIFSSYSFYENTLSKDLYFIGRKRSLASQELLPSVGNIKAVKLIIEVSEKFQVIEDSLNNSSLDLIKQLSHDVFSNYEMSNLALTRLMKYLIRVGDYDEALKYGNIALQYKFNQVANLSMQSRCYLKKGNLESAYQLMKRVNNLPQILSPKNAIMMADIESKLFGSKFALLTIKKSLQVFPNEKQSIWRLYIWSKKVGQKEEADKALAKMKELHPMDVRLAKL
jgi:tetratricopeptide (TPR) repeat protein